MLAKYQLYTSNWLAGYNAGGPLVDALKNEDKNSRVVPKGHQKAKTGTPDRDPKKINTLFGKDHTGFSIPETPVDLLNVAEGLRRLVGGNDILTWVGMWGAIRCEEIAALTTSPRFGGFEGMYPGQRLNDPGSTPEPSRPHSGDPAWWALLGTLRTCLEGTVTGLGTVPDNRKMTIALTQKNAVLFLATLNALIDTHNNVLPFEPDDWDYVVMNSEKPWTFVTGVPGAFAGQGQCAKVFRLNVGGGGGTTTLVANVGAVPRGTVKVMRTAAVGFRDKMKFHSS
jgi:hypothetical protein